MTTIHHNVYAVCPPQRASVSPKARIDWVELAREALDHVTKNS